jgi:hypothetical protein
MWIRPYSVWRGSCGGGEVRGGGGGGGGGEVLWFVLKTRTLNQMTSNKCRGTRQNPHDIPKVGKLYNHGGGGGEKSAKKGS